MAYLFQSGSLEAQLSGGVDFNYSNVETDKLMAINSDAAAPNAAAGTLGLGAAGAGSDGALYWDGSALCVAAAGSKTAHFDGDGLDLVSGDAYLINNTSVLNATTLGSAVVNSSLQSLGTQAEALDMGDYNISNVGDIDADSISVADAANGLNIDGSGANTGTFKITLKDAMADALNVTEGSNSYLKFATTDGSELITFGKNSTFASTTIANLGTVTTADIDGGSIDGVTIGANSAGNGTFAALVGTSLSVGDGDITNVGDIALDTISADGTTIEVDMTDNTAEAFNIAQGATNYLKFDTTDGSELITVGVNWTAASQTCANLGTVTTADIDGGSIDGVTIGANSAAAGTFSTITGTGLDINGAADISGDLTLSAGGDGALRFSAASSIKMLDNSATSLVIEEADNAYLTFDTQDGSENIVLGKKLTAGSVEIEGSAFDINGGAIDGTIIGANSAAAGTFTAVKGTTLSGSSTLNLDGAAQFNGAITVKANQNITLGYTTDTALSVANDALYFLDADNGYLRVVGIGSFCTDIAGAGLSVSGNKLTLEGQSVTTHGVGVNQQLSGGMNVATAQFAANRTWTLPRANTGDTGDIYRVKVTSMDGNTLTIAPNSNDAIDDLAASVSIDLESDNASISLMCVDNGSSGKWKIF